jgi:hypothetical protein
MQILERSAAASNQLASCPFNVGVVARIDSLGKEAEPEGKKARAFPLRFVDGTVYVGPLKAGQIPPLFQGVNP